MNFEVGEKAMLLTYDGKERGIITVKGKRKISSTEYYVIGSNDGYEDHVTDRLLRKLSPLEQLL